MADTEKKTGGEVLEKERPRTDEPQLYHVILHNDDYTSMEFVVMLLETLFHKSPAEAHRIMMHVHSNGHGICGAFPYEVAETKVALVHERAHEAGYPLRASMEEA